MRKLLVITNDVIDVDRPETLVYVPKANGKLELVSSTERRMRTRTSGRTLIARRSSVRGFDGPMPGHNPFMPIHYDMHVWVAEENPSGVFALFNPALSC